MLIPFERYIIEGEILKGGLADDMTLNQFDEDQIKIGLRIEMEHTDDPNIALEIVKDHLKEDPKYYEKLKKSGL